jgi:4-hydroxy-tetrahydrodipicolinate reductase
MGNAIRVAVVGACGRMGSEVVRAVCEYTDLMLVGTCDITRVGEKIADVCGVTNTNVIVTSNWAQMLSDAKPSVLVDFSKPFDLNLAKCALEIGCVPIVGTTGQTTIELKMLEQESTRTGVGVMVIPNFAIGAVLMMKFAAEASKYMPSAEIIELHHDKKVDAPSGTSIKTAEMIDHARTAAGIESPKPVGADDVARGDGTHGVNIHSVRLPGLVAHQEVIFGGLGQTLTIRHDSMDRTSFMPGVLLAIRKAACGVDGLVYGLDKLI